MFGIRQFDAVINPPQAMIMAAGAGDRRPVIMGDEVKIATIMTATGSFDHRAIDGADRSEEHTSELQSLMRISYAVFCLKKKTNKKNATTYKTKPIIHNHT